MLVLVVALVRQLLDQYFSSYAVFHELHWIFVRHALHTQRHFSFLFVLYLLFLSNLRLPNVSKHSSHWCSSYLPGAYPRSAQPGHTRSLLRPR